MTRTRQGAICGLIAAGLALQGCDDVRAPTQLNEPTLGALRVLVATTGADLDRDGYRVTVDAAPQQTVGVNGTLLLEGLSTGSHDVELGGVAANCRVSGPNPRSATVTSRDTARVAFAVDCVAAAVASVTLDHPAPTLAPGETVQLTARAYDAEGNELVGRVVTWSSVDVAVATVSRAGAVTAVGLGTTAVTATVEGKTATATITVTPSLVFASVSAGYSDSCGVTTDGAAYCWGSNSYGQLGNGSTTGRTTPTAVVGGVTFAVVSAGVFDTCGLTTGGNAYCWGGVYGLTPVPVEGGVRFLAISVGISHACGLTADGAAYCWGENGLGQLGTGDLTPSPTPAPVSGGLTFRSLSAGWYYTCGVTRDGIGYCWGSDGALGYAATDPCEYDEPTNSLIACSKRPMVVEGGRSFAQVGTGEGFTCGLTTDGAVYCWGFYPERGSIAPVAIPGGLTFAALSVDAQRACGVMAGGSADCWGWIPVQNQFSNAPTPVPGGLTFAAVSVGWFHTCGVTPNGTAYCWGANADGELGDGSQVNSLVPVNVTGPR